MTPDDRARRCARSQRGRITVQQLRAAGLTEREIRGRKRRGELVTEHRGVYAYAHLPPVPFAREQSALLACGGVAKLSHRSAAALRRLVFITDVVDVTVPPGRQREHRGVVIHQKHLEDHEWMVVDGLRTTAPLRTLHDLAEVVGVATLRRAINEAYVRGLVEPGELRPKEGARGVKTLRRALQEGGMTRSAAERLFLRLIRRAGIRPPDVTNLRFGTWEIDAVWVAEGVAVEIDVFGTHAAGDRFLRDRRKDLALRAQGLTVLRYTDAMLEDEPLSVVADLARALAGAAPSPHSRLLLDPERS